MVPNEFVCSSCKLHILTTYFLSSNNINQPNHSRCTTKLIKEISMLQEVLTLSVTRVFHSTFIKGGNEQFLTTFWTFFSAQDEQINFWSFASGILRHKFRVPTKGNFEKKIFSLSKGSRKSVEAKLQPK